MLTAELDRIAAMGVRVTCGHKVEDLVTEREEGAFDAVFVAVGAHLSKRVDIPARDAGRIVDAVSFLRSVASGERPVIGRRVAVFLIYGSEGQGGEKELNPRYFEAANEPKTLWEVPGAGHTGGIDARSVEYEQRVVSFFDDALLDRAA